MQGKQGITISAASAVLAGRLGYGLMSLEYLVRKKKHQRLEVQGTFLSRS